MAGKRKEREPARDEPFESRRDIPNPPLVFRARDPPGDDMESNLALEQARQIQYELSHPLVHRPKERSNNSPEQGQSIEQDPQIQRETSNPQSNCPEHTSNDGLEHSSGHRETMVLTTTQPEFRWLRCCFLHLLNTPFEIRVTLNVDTISSLRQWVDLDPSHSTFVTPTKSVEDGLLERDISPLHEDSLITSNYPLSGDPEFDIIIVKMNTQKLESFQMICERLYGRCEMAIIHTEYSPVNGLDDTRTCTREDTVLKLANLLDTERLVLVRGTPASGKTAILRLLKQHFRQQGRTVYSLALSKNSIKKPKISFIPL